MTAVELIVLAVVVLLFMALLVWCLTAMRREVDRTQCIANMRRLGLGIERYNADWLFMPSAHRNIWWLTREYVSPSISFGNGNQGAGTSRLYRCPSDRMLTDNKNGCSYAPNYENVDPFAAEAGYSLSTNGDRRNQAFSPFSNYKLAADAREAFVNDWFLGFKSLPGTSPSTILLIELWDPENRAYFYNPDGLTTQPPIVRNGEVQCPRPALEDYTGPAAGTTSGAKWVLSSNGQQAQGTFYSLKVFADQARSKGRDLDVDRRAYHDGRINVLFADQNVESYRCSRFFQTRVIEIPSSDDPLTPPTITVHNPAWTRHED